MKTNTKGKCADENNKVKGKGKTKNAKMELQYRSSRGYKVRKNETCINCYIQNKNTGRINFEYACRNENWSSKLSNYPMNKNENSITEKENKTAIANSAKPTYAEIMNNC